MSLLKPRCGEVVSSQGSSGVSMELRPVVSRLINSYICQMLVHPLAAHCSRSALRHKPRPALHGAVEVCCCQPMIGSTCSYVTNILCKRFANRCCNRYICHEAG